MSYAIEVTTPGDRGVYTRNQLVFRTKQEADDYGLDLALRWTAVQDVRTIEVDESVNYTYTDGCLRRLG